MWPKCELVDPDTALTILDSVYNGVIAIDDSGKIIIFNSGAERIFRRCTREVVGKHIKAVLPESCLPEVILTGQTQVSRFRSGGETIISTATPVKREEAITGAVAVFQNISEIESVAIKLNLFQAQNQELQTIIESSYDGIYVTDGKGVTRWINSAFEKMSGLAAREWVGKKLPEEYSEVIDSVVESRKAVSVMHPLKDNSEALVTGNPVFDEQGQIVSIVVNVRDIGQLKKLEEDLEYARNLSQRYQTELQHFQDKQDMKKSMVYKSTEMEQVVELALRAAKVDSTVLIFGETGVGKGVLTRAIHKASPRREGPFIQVNCCSIPETLLESELFGYEKGSFTGANKEGKPGMFELAQGGTIFLDEIGELSLNIQSKLLQVVEEKKIMRVGGVKQVRLNVRIITATNRDLKAMIRNKTFREDLYYRLNIIPITIPPLRKRQGDIIPLIVHYLDYYNKKYGLQRKLAPEVIDRLASYHWPGNVRELQNVIERLVVISSKDRITEDYLSVVLKEEDLAEATLINLSNVMPLRDAMEQLEKQLLEKALCLGGTTRRAAWILKINQSTVVRKAKKYQLNNLLEGRDNLPEIN